MSQTAIYQIRSGLMTSLDDQRDKFSEKHKSNGPDRLPPSLFKDNG